MGFKLFENAVHSGAQRMPNDMLRELEQEFINLQWDNSTAVVEVEEQEDIGSEQYNKIEVWITPTMQETTRGLADVNDFNKFVFKDINHKVKRGQMYIFNNNYWIIHSYNEVNGVVQNCGVRRCNNTIKIVDPLNGKLHIFPCCIDYDMASPSLKVNRYVNTPSNHATVIVQGNDLTNRLLKTNTRVMFSGRPFKLFGFQNAVEFDLMHTQTTLLYLDFYLDEIHDKDDIEKNIADNGKYDYSISINSNDLQLPKNSTGIFSADVLLNGVEVEKEILWESDNEDAVVIDEDGRYRVVGDIEDKATITARLIDNESVTDEVQIVISEEKSYDYVLRLNPYFEKIRQYDTVPFSIQLENGEESIEEFENIEVWTEDTAYVQLSKLGDNSYALKGLQITNNPITLKVRVQISALEEEINEDFAIRVVSMFG